ncbi:MAG: hypothetical protein IKH21_05605 [Clostridia bacterium]|nr:hypothetical protein [Clostridia bacterium]MBR3460253.1 hypothetical protein [Clostridia bacterium]
MRYCKNCHIVYSSQAAACPKCGIAEPIKTDSDAASEADRSEIRRDWLWIAIGVPVLIGVIYLLIKIIYSL